MKTTQLLFVNTKLVVVKSMHASCCCVVIEYLILVVANSGTVDFHSEEFILYAVTNRRK